ncbi:hypothetical protein E1211_15340 [Micromonospora sp. 15K316]|uniref:hypothetical protein n=1 Tax=Micromonospora sp. 15K316 TaxID=2530376 RepID=UPI001045758F|nr:hypothetical protein [Micromonospora sp. 15K316]TDC35678.1 hypothetical protein E1211_15340 [Micromonospora sp. 15K316]
MTELRMVALDLSTSKAGIAHTHWQGKRQPMCRSVNTGLMDLHDKIARVLADVAAVCGWSHGQFQPNSRPHLAVVEGSFSRPGASDGPLHMLRGVVLHRLWTWRIPYVDVQPGTLKVWATGSGALKGENKVTKDKVIAAVLSTYGGLIRIDPRDSDQCDAVALLSMGMAAYGQPLVRVTNSYQTRALDVPKWPTLATESGPVVPA